MQGRAVVDPKAGGLVHAHPVRYAADGPFGGDRVLCKAAARLRQDTLSYRETRDPWPQRIHYAPDLGTGHVRQGRLDLVAAERNQGVDETDPAGSDLDTNFALARLGRRQVDRGIVVDGAEISGLYGLH